MTSLRSVLSATFFGGVILASVACGSTTNYTAQVYVKASMGPNTTNAPACMLAPGFDWLDIGTTDGQSYNLIQNGQSEDGANIGVDCRITTTSTGFDVNVTASKSGATNGGSLTISGSFTSSGVQQNITASFGRPSTGTFDSSSCTVTFTNMYMGVDSGRVWGVIDCPNAISDADSTRVCDGTSEFRFENCSQ